MKKVILLLLLSCITITGIAQSLRTVNGVVFNEKGAPMKGVLIKPNTEQDGVLSSDNGTFTIKVSLYAKKMHATFDGYFPVTLEIDGSYLVFNMKINKEYLELKLKAEQEAKKVADAKEKEKLEAERKAAEAAAAKAKIEAEAKLEAERKAAQEAAAQATIEAEAKIEAERKAAEAAAKAEIEAEAKIEAERKAAEAAAAKAKIEAEAKIKAERKAQREAIAKNIPEKGFGSFIDFVYQCYQPFTGYNDYIGAHYIGGYRFNKKCFLGAGIGLNISSSPSDGVESLTYIEDGELKLPDADVVIPVYAYFRVNLIDKKCSPFVALAVGGKFAKANYVSLSGMEIEYGRIGAFINPQLGVNFQVTPRSKLYFAVGVNGYNMNKLHLDNWHYNLSQSVYYGLDFHIGFSF